MGFSVKNCFFIRIIRQTADETVMDFNRLDFLTVDLADIAHINLGNQFPYDACRQFLQVTVLPDKRNPLPGVLCCFLLLIAFLLEQRKLRFQFPLLFSVLWQKQVNLVRPRLA